MQLKFKFLEVIIAFLLEAVSVAVAVGKLIEVIPLLSVATAAKVMVWDWESVVRATFVELAVNDEIAGFSLSILATTTLNDSVSVFPASSVTVAVKLKVLFPKLAKSL